jgi:hypothetical protein
MTGSPPYHKIATPFCVLLVVLTLPAAPADAGLLEKVKSFTAPRLASTGLIKAIGDYTGGILEEGTKLVKEGLSGNIDSATYSRRHDEFLDKKVHMGVKSFLKDAADNLKLKVSNPLEGLKEKLGGTLLGRAAASVKEKIWATTAESAGAGVAKPDEQYGAIDPRIALDVQEEETEWYQAETGLMDETPLPQAEVVAHVDQDRAGSPAGDWSAYGEGDGQSDPVHRDCENDWAGCANASSNGELQANVQERNPWSDIDDGADEWEDRAASDCTNPWVDIDADCGDGYQGEGSRSDETDVARRSDEAQGGTYQEAVDRLLGNESASYSDEYSASDEGYEEALAQLEAEAAERERQARLAAEAAERERRAAEQERLARLAAEEAEREREAWLAAERQREWQAAERQRQADANRYDASGAILGALSGGIIRGLEDSGKIAPGASSALAGIAGLSQGSSGGFASGLNQSLNALNALSAIAPNYGSGGLSGGVASRPSSNCQNLDQEVSRELNAMNLEGGGMCQNARTYIRVLSHVKERLSQYGCYNGEYDQAIQQARQAERAACNR